MMYTAKFLTPKNKAIDATVANTFSWQPQGEPQVSYQVRIYDISDNTLKYDSTQIANGESKHTIPANSLNNSKQYKWSVEVYGVSGSVVSDYVFIATNSTPTITMSVPNPMITQTYKFTAIYSQAENIGIKKFKFVLYDYADRIIKDTDWIYGFSLEYLADGLLDGNDYQIECIAVSQNDMEGTSGKLGFSMEYSMPDVPRGIRVIPDNENGINIIGWGNLKQVTPTVTGNFDYVEGRFDKGLLLDDSTYIEYDEPVSEEFSFTWHVSPEIGFSGTMLQLDDSFYFGYENSRFYVINQSVKFISDRIIIYSWEDLKNNRWNEIAYNTWDSLSIEGQHMNGFLFIGVTFNDVIIKRYGKTIAKISMSGVM